MPCEPNVSRLHWGTFVKFGTNLHRDRGLTCLYFAVKGYCDFTYCEVTLMWDFCQIFTRSLLYRTGSLVINSNIFLISSQLSLLLPPKLPNRTSKNPPKLTGCANIHVHTTPALLLDPTLYFHCLLGGHFWSFHVEKTWRSWLLSAVTGQMCGGVKLRT